MTNLKTISELGILSIACDSLLEKWLREQEKVDNNPDKEMPIAKHRAAKYKAQWEEVRSRVIELEEAQ